MAKKELKLHVSDDNVITVCDNSGGILLKNSSGASIEITKDGKIVLKSAGGATLVLDGPEVKING